jgi:hypothetical protein
MKYGVLEIKNVLKELMLMWISLFKKYKNLFLILRVSVEILSECLNRSIFDVHSTTSHSDYYKLNVDVARPNGILVLWWEMGMESWLLLAVGRDDNGFPRVRVSHYQNPHLNASSELKSKAYSGGKITLTPTSVEFGFFHPNSNS